MQPREVGLHVLISTEPGDGRESGPGGEREIRCPQTFAGSTGEASFRRGCMSSVLVSWACCHKAPHAGRLRTTEMYCLSVLEAMSPKSNSLQSRAPSEGAREGHLRPRSWIPVVAWLWQHNSNLHMAVSLCVYVCVQISPFYKDTSHIGLGGPPLSLANYICNNLIPK